MISQHKRIGRRTTPYGLYNIMDFGKHYGSNIQTIIEQDPDYLAWCCDNVGGFRLTDEAEAALDEALLEG